jgi:hypothetical protein
MNITRASNQLSGLHGHEAMAAGWAFALACEVAMLAAAGAGDTSEE